MDDIWIFIFEVILFPASKEKRINPFVRFLCVALILLLFVPLIVLCIWVGINIIRENVFQGILLITIGIGAIFYLYYEYHEVKNRNQ